MGRGPKSTKGKAKPAAPPTSRKNGAAVRDLEERLAEALGQLQTRDRELGEALKREAAALEQQTATSEILRVISNSPTDIQPVVDSIAAKALDLCEAKTSAVFRFDGGLIHVVAAHSFSPEAVEAHRQTYPIPPGRGGTTARAILSRAVVYIPDIREDSEYEHQALAKATDYLSALSVPMLHESEPVGAITVTRAEAGAFSQRQIELLQTFADQAVIAIQNVRLFKELETRNYDLTESLERQTATAEILRVIASSPTDLQPVLDAVTERAARLCGASDAVIFRADGGTLTPVATCGVPAVSSVPRTRGTASGRAIVDRQPVHVEDLASPTSIAEFPDANVPRARGIRTQLAVPLLREGEAVGVILIRRFHVQPFTEQQIALLQTFADQAVIAIENVRLFNETKEALERQTATSDILRVISSSPTDVQPVFEAVLASGVRLCGAQFGGVFRFDGELIHLVTSYEWPQEYLEALRRHFPMAPGDGSLVARAIRDRRVVQTPDYVAEARAAAGTLPPWVSLGETSPRSTIAIPMMREGSPLGGIVLARAEPGLFSDQHVALLQTFADQAVIAIENVRLFKELQASNGELRTALDTQTATSDILSVISRSQTDAQPVFEAILSSAVRLLGAYSGALSRVVASQIELVAFTRTDDAGAAALRAAFPQSLQSELPHAQAIRDRVPLNIADAQADPRLPEAEHVRARVRGFRSRVLVPLLRHEESIGAISVARREPGGFNADEITLLKTFADQAVIAIENVRLFTELQEKNLALTQAHAQVSEALDQQTATAEILRVISQSPTDLRPVFDTIVRNAVQLCGATYGSAYRIDGDVIYLVAEANLSGAGWERFRMSFPRPLRDGGVLRDVVESRRPQYLENVDAYPFSEAARALFATNRTQSLLTVPMIRQDQVIGAFSLFHPDLSGFPDGSIDLVRTFADQAVIAIENVRLFKELDARTQDLMRSVDELTALGEVGRAVSSTLDLETVLSTIVSRAIQLSRTDGGSVYEYDEATEEFSLRASRDLPEAYVEQVRDTRPRKGEGAVGRVAQTREPVQIADIADATAYESRVRNILLQMGLRALLAVPLIAEDQLVGALIVMRRRSGTFAAEEVALLQTFATQSALAIQNARLFREIEDKSRQLEVASRHKSEFLANMSHELRTPLNAIIGFSEVLSERMFGELNEKQEEYLKDIYASGNHLLSLINDILDLSKIEAGRMELELSDFHLPTALDSALTLVRERAGRRSIFLHLSVDERLGQIQGDERKVRQVVLNLLSNAIKFTPEGGRIEISAVPRDGSVEVAVRDTGVGIAPEDQEAVFEEFRQVGTADKKVEGTGLGLTLCRKFVELHGGRIWLKSQVGVGSAFTFTIPVRRGE